MAPARPQLRKGLCSEISLSLPRGAVGGEWEAIRDHVSVPVVSGVRVLNDAVVIERALC